MEISTTIGAKVARGEGPIASWMRATLLQPFTDPTVGPCCCHFTCPARFGGQQLSLWAWHYSLFIEGNRGRGRNGSFTSSSSSYLMDLKEESHWDWTPGPRAFPDGVSPALQPCTESCWLTWSRNECDCSCMRDQAPNLEVYHGHSQLW